MYCLSAAGDAAEAYSVWSVASVGVCYLSVSVGSVVYDTVEFGWAGKVCGDDAVWVYSSVVYCDWSDSA